MLLSRIFKNYTSNLWMLIIIILLSIIILIHKNCQATCPNAIEIHPCTCDDEGLQCLRLNNTGLEKVFNSFAERKAIRRVWIYQTNLTSIKTRAFGDYIIRDLYLDINQIEKIEKDAFGKAAMTLQTLSLSRNLLRTFPYEEFTSFIKLKRFGLGHNLLIDLPSYAFTPSYTLESLDLSHNKIQKIGSFAFADLYELSSIDLSRNRLEKLETNSLVIRTNAKNLAISLRGNYISSIGIDVFGNYHPGTLDLSQNRLTYLDEYVFGPLLMNNTLINVGENPFSCFGCDNYKWLLELGQEHLNNLDNFSCIDDTRLDELTYDNIGCPFVH